MWCGKIEGERQVFLETSGVDFREKQRIWSARMLGG